MYISKIGLQRLYLNVSHTKLNCLSTTFLLTEDVR